MKEILQITCEDGVTFNSEGMSVEKINKDADYTGLRITMSAALEKAEKNIQIDMGFGDVIVSGPVLIEYPVLLERNPRPKIYVYSLSSAISEKLEAIAKLGFLNSRMKDFYDIAFLSKTNLFKMSDLYEAITKTFENRKTSIGNLDIIFGDEFAASKENQEKWSAFNKRSKLNDKENFSQVMNRIKMFILPVLDSKPIELQNIVWIPGESAWKKPKEKINN